MTRSAPDGIELALLSPGQDQLHDRTKTEGIIGMSMRYGFSAVVAAVLVTGAVGCGGASKTTTSSPTSGAMTSSSLATAPGSPPQATAYRIMIEGLGYTNLSVPAGALISVVNKDDVEHTVTSDAHGVFDVDLPPHAQAQFRAPSTPGTYPYHCTYHPGMYGELIVT